MLLLRLINFIETPTVSDIRILLKCNNEKYSIEIIRHKMRYIAYAYCECEL